MILISQNSVDNPMIKNFLVRMKLLVLLLLCHRLSAATYGTGWPLVGSAGGRRVAQRADQRTTVWQRAHKRFTQVRAAARHKTLLLLWWIDGGMNGVVCNTLCPTRFS